MRFDLPLIQHLMVAKHEKILLLELCSEIRNNKKYHTKILISVNLILKKITNMLIIIKILNKIT